MLERSEWIKGCEKNLRGGTVYLKNFRCAAKAEKAAPPRRRTKGKGPGGKLGALLAELDKENARRGKKGLPPMSYGKYVQLFGR